MILRSGARPGGDGRNRATTKGSLDINSWVSIDPDGYTVWVDGSQSQAIGTNGLVTGRFAEPTLGFLIANP